MFKTNFNTNSIRRLEQIVLCIGMLVALGVQGLNASDAFRVNMRGSDDIAGFLLTCWAFLVMGIIVIAPFILLWSLGKKISNDECVSNYQITGLLISFLATVTTIYLYIDAHFVVANDSSSTAGLVFLAIPIIVVLVAGGLYRILVFMYEHSKKRKNV